MGTSRSDFYDLPVESKQRCLGESKTRHHLSQTISKRRNIHRQFRRLVNGDAEEALKVFEAARGCGFFDLSNAHIDYESMFDTANETFELPLEEKMKYEMSNTLALLRLHDDG